MSFGTPGGSWSLSLLILAILMVAAAALNHGSVTAQQTTRYSEADDRLFIERTVARSLWKAKVSSIAAKQAASNEVREFGGLIAESYLEVQAEALALAEQNQMSISPRLDFLEENTLSYFSTLQQAALDREYLSVMSDSLREDLQDYDFHSEKAAIQSVRQFASKMIVKAKTFLEQVDKLMDRAPKPCLK